jgi:hypothetical protein
MIAKLKMSLRIFAIPVNKQRNEAQSEAKLVGGTPNISISSTPSAASPFLLQIALM